MQKQVKVKICGLMNQNDIMYVNEMMPDYAGFVLSHGQRRSISEATLKILIQNLHPSICRVGVFVNEEPEKIVAFLNQNLIDMAQLNGEESEEDIMYIKAVTGKPVIKVVEAADTYIVEAWLDSAADYLLFTTGKGDENLDFRLIQNVERDFFLAGQLTYDIIEKAVFSLHPFAVDLGAGVEMKDRSEYSEMKKIVSKVRNL